MMSRNSRAPIRRNILLIASTLYLCGLQGCALLRKPKSKLEAAAPPPDEVAMAVGKGDTATSVDLGLKKLDSAAVPSAYASQLYLMTIDNYLGMAGDDPKVAEVLVWKANHIYNQGDFEKALTIYQDVRKRFPNSSVVGEASQMAAQAYAQLGRFDEAEKTYRSMLKGSDVGAQTEAKDRLAQAMYLEAEKAEKDGRLQVASEQYARLAKEFPSVEIAPVALFNAGVMQEKQKKWGEAIKLYDLFFDAFFESKLLPKVLFREAKCREFDGQWESAGDKYLNLVKAYPDAKEAEPSLYNAGFAYFNGKKQEAAAKSFEAYALKYPQNPESPNLLFRAVEIYGELQNWDKVAELQSLFSRRYASDKGRLLQALCLGGTAAFQRGHSDEAAQLMGRVISEFTAMKTSDASARFYAAQAQHTQGEIIAKRMRDTPIRIGNYDGDLKVKTALLKSAVDAYLKVLDYRIVDWALRAAFSLGQSFEEFGTQVYQAPRKPARNPSDQLDREEDAITALSAAYAKAQQQYIEVLAIGRKQEVNNKWVGDASARLVSMATRFEGIQVAAMATVPTLIKVDAGTPEKAIAGKLLQIGRITPFHEQGMKYFNAFLDLAQEYELDPKAADSLGGKILQSMLSLGGHYLSAAELARGAPFPSGFQPMERFFYQVKLLQEGIPKLEAKAIEYFQSGLDFSAKYGLTKNPVNDTLRMSLGRALYVQAKCLDLLSHEALVTPPIPPEAGPEQRKTYQEKLETVGYQLQDQALERYHHLIDKVVSGAVPVEWGELAFARLYQIEPDKWSRTSDADTTMEIVTGKEWMAISALPASGWPPPESPDWAKVRKGIMPNLDFPDYVKKPFRFLWAGDKGQGPKIDSVTATYIPWKQVWAQIPVNVPAKVQGMDLEVVAPQDWVVCFDKDTVLTNKGLTGPWFKGLSKDVFPIVSKRPKNSDQHFLRVYSQNAKPTDGMGIWVRLRIRYKLPGAGPLFPWNQTTPSPEYLKKLLEQEIPIPNFNTKARK